MTHHVIPHINVFYSLVIFMILSEMYRVLTVAVDLNWIMCNFQSIDQFSQP